MNLPSPLPAFANGAVPQTMAPRVLRELESLHAKFPTSEEHRRVLRLLGSDFVYAGQAVLPSVRSSGVWVALVRLSQTLERRFGIGAELLAVYSPHDDLQIRTVDRLPDYIRGLPPDRKSINRGIYFFWAPDIRLEDKLASLSRVDRTLLPLPELRDMSGDGPDEFLATIASRLYTRDLYAEHSAVTGDQFFGRERLMQAITVDVESRRVPAVFGMRKTGKTSVLKELERTNAQRSLGGRSVVFVYWDLEYLPPIGEEDPVSDLVRDLSDRVRTVLKDNGFETKDLSEITGSTSVADFRRALDKVLQRKKNAELHLVIILDEVEYLCPPSADSDQEFPSKAQKVPQFFGALRKVAQERGNFSFVLAGLASASVEAGMLFGRHNPLFSFAQSYYMTPFGPDEAERLLNGIGARIGVTWTPDAALKAHSETGGHALLLRELASTILKSFDADRTSIVEITEQDVVNVIPVFSRSIAPDLTEILRHVERFYRDEWDLLRYLKDESDQFQELAQGYPTQVRRLENLGLITNRGTHWAPTRILELGWAVIFGGGPLGRGAESAEQSAMPALEELLSGGEGSRVEFKSSIRVSLHDGIPDEVVTDSAIVAIVGMMNARGGTLLVGVNDLGDPIGLERDIEKCGSLDKLQTFVAAKLNSTLGAGTVSTVHMTLAAAKGVQILRFDVPAAKDAVWAERPLKKKPNTLWVRQAANTQPLEGREAADYIRSHWSASG